MQYEDAEKVIAQIRTLKNSLGWSDFLLPEIDRRLTQYRETALALGSNTEAHAEARYRHNELTTLLEFIESAERNATESCRDALL